jgi:hypothetical protein
MRTAEMSTVEDVWRRKTDFELEAAASRLGEYTDEGQRVILAEFHRRHLETSSSAEVTSGGSADNEVLAPRDRIQEGWMWIAAGTIITVGTYIVGTSIRGGYVIAWGPIVYGLRQIWRGQRASSSGRPGHRSVRLQSSKSDAGPVNNRCPLLRQREEGR